MAEPGANRPAPGPWSDGATAVGPSPIHYTLTDADMVLAQRAWLLAGMRWGALLGIVAVASALIGVVMLIDGRPLVAADIWPFVGIILMVALIPFILYWLMPRRALKLFHQQKAAAHEITIAWDAEAIGFSSALGHVRLPWPLFSSWLDAPSTLALYQSDMLFNPIPKRVLTAAESADIVGHLRAAGVAERHRFGFHSTPRDQAPDPGGL